MHMAPVGEPHVQRVAVGGRVDGNGLDSELVQRADHPDGDLAAVRNRGRVREQDSEVRAARRSVELEQELPELDGLPVLDVDRAHAARRARLSAR